MYSANVAEQHFCTSECLSKVIGTIVWPSTCTIHEYFMKQCIDKTLKHFINLNGYYNITIDSLSPRFKKKIDLWIKCGNRTKANSNSIHVSRG